MIKRLRLGFLFISLTGLSLTFLSGCDSQFYVKGKVVELVNAPSTGNSTVYIVNTPFNPTAIRSSESPPEGYKLQPVSSANISFSLGGEYYYPFFPIHGGSPLPIRYMNNVTSDSEGNFERAWIVGPGKYDIKIKIDKAGYYPVERKFPFDGSDPGTFDVTVVLVRKPTQ